MVRRRAAAANKLISRVEVKFNWISCFHNIFFCHFLAFVATQKNAFFPRFFSREIKKKFSDSRFHFFSPLVDLFRVNNASFTSSTIDLIPLHSAKFEPNFNFMYATLLRWTWLSLDKQLKKSSKSISIRIHKNFCNCKRHASWALEPPTDFPTAIDIVVNTGIFVRLSLLQCNLIAICHLYWLSTASTLSSAGS